MKPAPPPWSIIAILNAAGLVVISLVAVLAITAENWPAVLVAGLKAAFNITMIIVSLKLRARARKKHEKQ